MKALIADGKVVQVENNEFPVAPKFFWVECPQNCQPGWDYINNELIPPIILEKTIEEKIFESEQALLSHIDMTAKSKLYESALHCASYVSSTIPSWKSEAEVFIEWRDSVFMYAIQQTALMQSGERSVPSFDDFKNELPVINWP